MKTKIFSMLALAAMLLTVSSCQKEGVDEPEKGKVTTVQLAVELPDGINARAPKANGPKRAYADGTRATKLQYAVYEKDSKEPLKIIDGKDLGEQTINLKTTVSLQLVTGKTYQIVFWAANAEAPYKFDQATQCVTVDYTNMKANEENLDAFYRCYEYTAGTDVENPIKLYRPFSQLNVGTKDLAAAKASGFNTDVATTEVKVTGIYNTLNLVDGAVSGDAERTFAFNEIPTGETFPKADYDYLSMDYMLVAADKANVDVDWKITDKNTTINRHFANVPVQRNYRTNIYGNLLTSATDFNVEIEPNFNKPDYEYTVQTAEEFYNAINADGDVKISLTGDINLNEVKGTVGSGKYEHNYVLYVDGKNVTIDLNDHKLSTVAPLIFAGNTVELKNGTIVGGEKNDAVIRAFGKAKMTLDNLKVLSPDADHANCAVYVQDAGTMLNVKNSSLQTPFYGIGTNASEGATNNVIVNVENSNIEAQTAICFNVAGTLSVKNTKLNGYWQGLMLRGGTATIEGCEINQAFDTAKDIEGGKGNHRTAEEAAKQYMSGSWTSGNEVPMAAIVLGTDGANVYQYPTVLNMKGTKVVGNAPFRAVVQREAGLNIVTYNDNGGNTITGDWLVYNDNGTYTAK